jgi:Rps23 Pro-64 3,4-dihydroxylase Tpa1-like proline 4-hydroxylase
VNKEKYIKYLNFLTEKNCHNIQHSGRSFLQHLVGTFNLLKKWKQHEDLCIAGMFHNVYGNKYFDVDLNIDRNVLSNLIGKNAEELVWEYTNIDRENIVKTNNKDFILLNLANELEQDPLFEIIDNTISKEEIKEIHTYFENIPWLRNGSSRTTESKKWNYPLNFEHNIEQKLLNHTNLILKSKGLDKLIKFKRAYASANFFGDLMEYHTDDNSKEFNEIFTVMYYLNEDWNIEWGGETSFLNVTNTEIQHTITPKPGRIVLFDGFITHGPKPLNFGCNKMRIVLTFKFELFY